MQRRAARRKAYGTPPQGLEIVRIFHEFIIGMLIMLSLVGIGIICILIHYFLTH